MKTTIHPNYTHDAKVTCSCGNSFVTGSTVEEIHVEICHMCHPFYTGKSKMVDTAGRVERFQKLQEQQTKAAGKRIGKKAKKTKQQAARSAKTEKK